MKREPWRDAYDAWKKRAACADSESDQRMYAGIVDAIAQDNPRMAIDMDGRTRRITACAFVTGYMAARARRAGRVS